MNQHFAELFSIDCRHAYFADAVARPIYLTPTADCVDLLRRYRLLTRRRPGGCAVYYDTADPHALVAGFDETAAFNFMLASSDPYLFNYTEWPFAASTGASGTIPLFDNRQDFPDGLLHPAGAASSVAALPVQVGPFTQALVKPVVSADVELRAGVDWQPAWRTRTSTQPQSSATVDTTRLPCGRYQLWVDNEKQVEFCLCDDSVPHPWGMVSIFAGGRSQATHLPAGRYPIGTDGQVAAQHYQISLANRSTIWRYYVINQQPQSALGGTVLVKDHRDTSSGDTKNVQFVKLDKTIAVNGASAAVFESQQPLPLLQTPGADLQLSYRVNGDGLGAVRDVRLPYPGPDSLASDSEAPQRLRSDMYVYL